MFTDNEYLQELGFEKAQNKSKEKIKQISIITRHDHRYDNFPQPPLFVKGPPSSPPTQACMNAREQAMQDIKMNAKNLIKNN